MIKVKLKTNKQSIEQVLDAYMKQSFSVNSIRVFNNY